MEDEDPLVTALRTLCAANGGHAEVGRQIGANGQTLYQIVSGVRLPSGMPRGVGRSLRERLDARYPDWRSGASSTAVSALHETASRADSIPVPMLENAGSMGGGEDELSTDVVMGDIVLAREWITREVRPSSAEALRFVHALGDSMKPTCESGDILLVDTGHRTVDIDGVYVLRANQRLYIKRVRQTLAGGWEVSSDNATVKTVDVLDGHEQIEVLGRAVWVWNGKRL